MGYPQFVIVVLLIAMVLMLVIKFNRRPSPEGKLPSNLKVQRQPDGVVVWHRWGGTLDYILLLLYGTMIGLLTIDAVAKQPHFPAPPGVLLAYSVIVFPFGYALVLLCVNHTVFKITATEITARSGPLPALEPDRRLQVADLERIVCIWHGTGGGSYKVYASPKSGRPQTIADGYWGGSVPVALARLIVEAVPSLRLDLELSTAAERRARRQLR